MQEKEDESEKVRESVKKEEEVEGEEKEGRDGGAESRAPCQGLGTYMEF